MVLNRARDVGMRNSIVYLTNEEFKQCVSEPCVFYRWENGKLLCMLMI